MGKTSIAHKLSVAKFIIGETSTLDESLKKKIIVNFPSDENDLNTLFVRNEYVMVSRILL